MIVDNVEWGNMVEVVCVLVCDICYEDWLYEIFVSLKVVEMCMKNVFDFYLWIVVDLEGDNFD